MKLPYTLEIFLVLTCFIVRLEGNRLNEISTINQYLNTCQHAEQLKPWPSPEKDLPFCQQWVNNSCCAVETAEEIKNELHLGFNFSHCGQMSRDCLDIFKLDYCFVKCSPNLGPWIVQMDQSKFNERTFKVPLCESQCNVWYDACKDDKTCATNWQSGGFDWTTGENLCRSEFHCDSIGNIYGNAKAFCERVWDHAYVVIPDQHNGTWEKDPEHCMNLTTPLHNRKIAEAEAKFILGRLTSACTMVSASSTLLLLLTFQSIALRALV